MLIKVKETGVVLHYYTYAEDDKLVVTRQWDVYRLPMLTDAEVIILCMDLTPVTQLYISINGHVYCRETEKEID